MLTRQHRNVLAYLTAACEAAVRGDTTPSLLPTPAQLKGCMQPAA
jgi:hypothetical protein